MSELVKEDLHTAAAARYLQYFNFLERDLWWKSQYGAEALRPVQQARLPHRPPALILLPQKS